MIRRNKPAERIIQSPKQLIQAYFQDERYEALFIGYFERAKKIINCPYPADERRLVRLMLKLYKWMEMTDIGLPPYQIMKRYLDYLEKQKWMKKKDSSLFYPCGFYQQFHRMFISECGCFSNS